MDNKIKTAVVTGANGFVGSHLCRELINSNYRVIAVHRANSNLSAISDLNIERQVADLSETEKLKEIFKNADVVFHIAALFREARFADQVYFDVNLQGTKNVFDAAIAVGVKKIIYCSTNGVMGDINQPPANESHPYNPGDVYQVSKCEAEKLALNYYNSGKITGSIIRPAMIWGPGDRRLLKLFTGVKKRNLPIIGNGKTLFHFIYISDLAKAFRLAAEYDDSNGEIFLIAGAEIVSIEKVYKVISEYLGVKALKIKIPELPVYILSAIIEFACKPFGIEPPLFRRRVKFFTKSRAFDISKAKKLLNFQPEYTFEQEVALLGDWYRKQGWL